MKLSNQKKGSKDKYHKRRTRVDRPYLGHEFQGGTSYVDSLNASFYIKSYMQRCRGLQLRNWTQVNAWFKFMKTPPELVTVIYNSWVMFKVARSLRPERSSIYVYILKNFSDLEGQKIYDDVYEQYTEQPYETTRNFYVARKKDSRYFRLMEYFYHEDPEWILPLSVFPRIDFEKSKMHYCDEDYSLSPDLLKEVHEKVFNYIMRLDIKKLFMPRGDVMQKTGTQRYNDGGTVRYDFERPTNSFDSSFKYQRFLTMPLTPREVWLPGKAIKQNNAFMMTVHRQILQADPTYPSTDLNQNLERLSKYMKNGFLKFDIAGFGFQYLRELLSVGNRAIRELFPCTVYEEQSDIMEMILDSVSVEMPNGDFLYPKRGIGLGYYEDLKTIVMIALLQDHKPISIYGDQGLLDPFAIGFAEELSRFQFIMNWEKVDFGSSEGQTRWGGCVFTEDSVIKPKVYMENILGSFFSRHHWERKLSLRGFAKHFPEVYKGIQKRVAFMYEKTFGYEFFKSDSMTSFDNGGLMLKPRDVGHIRLWNIRGHMSPVSALTFDTTYQTPFKLAFDHKVTFKESKIFQRKRKTLYKSNHVNDSILYDYCNPLLVYNKKVAHVPRTLPRWADFNLIVYHSMSSGSLTCGLEGDEIMHAVNRQSFSSDPFRARATGGYSIDTRWRSARPPDQEWIDVADVMMDMDKAYSLYVNRADLSQNPMLADDPMYRDTNLFEGLISKIGKRKRSILSDGHGDLGNTMVEEVRSILPSLIKKSKVTHLDSLVTLVEERLKDYDKGYNVDESDYGDYAADESYYADAIDLVDLM
jgi:hypothetical protein